VNDPHQQAGQADVMERSGPNREEAAEPSPIKIPLGLRIAILFVRLTVLMAFFLAVGTGMTAILFLTEGAASSRPFPDKFVRSLVVVTASIVLLVMWVGAAWLDALLSQRSSSGVVKGELPLSRQLFIPAAGGFAVYGGMAILLWLLSFRETDLTKTWPWPLAWGIIGTSALFLWRHLSRTLPRE
jgi:hypothetical protein